MTDERTIDDDFLPPAHPEYTGHFTDPLYADPADDFAPFGSDEAADSVFGVLDAGTSLSTATLRTLLDAEFEGIDWESEADDDDAFDAVQIGFGFLLLRVNGRLDDEGVQLLRAAIERRRERYGDVAQLDTMLKDLDAFVS